MIHMKTPHEHGRRNVQFYDADLNEDVSIAIRFDRPVFWNRNPSQQLTIHSDSLKTEKNIF